MTGTRTDIAEATRMLRARVELDTMLGATACARSAASKHGGASLRSKRRALDALAQKLAECRDCPGLAERTQNVFGVGSPDARLMFVGEAPGRDEDRLGEPFVGRAGKLLTKIIEAMGFKREEVYIANILKCRPPDNRNPSRSEIAQCTPYLLKQIDIIAPRLIIALGTFAAQALLDTDVSIGRLRGNFYDYHGTPLLPTYHPAYLLRSPGEKGKVWDDVQKGRDYVLGKFEPEIKTLPRKKT